MTQHLHWHGENKKLQSLLGLHIVKDVVVVLREAFHPCIHPSCHPSMDGIIQGRKPWQKNITSSLRMCRCLGKPRGRGGGGGAHPQDFDINISNKPNIYLLGHKQCKHQEFQRPGPDGYMRNVVYREVLEM